MRFVRARRPFGLLGVFGIHVTAEKHQDLADGLYSLRAGAPAEFVQCPFPFAALQRGGADLDQLMSLERPIHLRDQLGGDALVADPHDRLQLVRARFELAPLRG